MCATQSEEDGGSRSDTMSGSGSEYESAEDADCAVNNSVVRVLFALLRGTREWRESVCVRKKKKKKKRNSTKRKGKGTEREREREVRLHVLLS